MENYRFIFLNFGQFVGQLLMFPKQVYQSVPLIESSLYFDYSASSEILLDT